MSNADRRRVVITGMAVNTPLGDTLDGFLAALLAGRSAITRWRALDTSRISLKIGGDLGGYDIAGKVASFEERLAEPLFRRLKSLVRRAPWSTRLSLLLALSACEDAGALPGDGDAERWAVLAAGHNLNSGYRFAQSELFATEPDDIDPLSAISGLDTDTAACLAEMLTIRGPIYTVGGACASGNLALRSALDEIRHHGIRSVLLIAPALELHPVELHAMALIGAVPLTNFEDAPEKASRPWDVKREGFVPAHGGAALILEDLEHATARGARIHAEVLAATASNDSSHLTRPSEENQARVIAAALREAGVSLEEIDFVSAHATSTPSGDLSEIRALKRVFGAHAARLKINAPKSLLGHTCWSAPIVETVAVALQMRSGRLHPSINIEQLDPEVDLEVCANRAVEHRARCALKNSFGFGGINCVSVLKAFEQ